MENGAWACIPIPFCLRRPTRQSRASKAKTLRPFLIKLTLIILCVKERIVQSLSKSHFLRIMLGFASPGTGQPAQPTKGATKRHCFSVKLQYVSCRLASIILSSALRTGVSIEIRVSCDILSLCSSKKNINPSNAAALFLNTCERH